MQEELVSKAFRELAVQDFEGVPVFPLELQPQFKQVMEVGCEKNGRVLISVERKFLPHQQLGQGSLRPVLP